MYGFTARWRCEAAFPTQALLLLLPLLHLSVLFITPLYILPLPVYISVLLCLPISLLPLPPPTASTAPVCPLLCGHRLGFTSGGLQLHQAPWSRPARPCGPAEEQSAGNKEIKATFNTCWFYCLKIQHVLFQSTKHMDSSSTSCDNYTRDASVY